MAVAVNDRLSGPYVCTGGETVLTYDFPLRSASDLAVFRTRGGASVRLVLDADYAVTGVGAAGGGTAVLSAAALAGDRFYVEGRLSPRRTADLLSERGLSAMVLNVEFDSLELQIQELRRDVDRAVKRSGGDARAGDLRLPEAGSGLIAMATDGTVSFIDPAFLGGGSGGGGSLDPVGVAAGGTGARNAADARDNLGLGGLATRSSVSGATIEDATVDTADLHDGAVTAAKLATGAVSIVVESLTATAPPASPVAGRAYVVAVGTAAAWGAGAADNALAVRGASAWTFYAPAYGWRVMSLADRLVAAFDGTIWQPINPNSKMAGRLATALPKGGYTGGLNRAVVLDGTAVAVWGAGAGGKACTIGGRNVYAPEIIAFDGTPPAAVAGLWCTTGRYWLIDDQGWPWSAGEGAGYALGHGDQVDLVRFKRIDYFYGNAIHIREIVPSRPSASDNVLVCFVATDGKVYTAGYGAHGQRGDGTTATGVLPTQVLDTTGAVLANVDTVSVGSDAHTVAARLTNGKIATWGYNGFGQIGNGGVANATRAVINPTLTTVKQVLALSNASSGNVYAVLNDGTALGAGSGGQGQLAQGAGDLTQHNAFVVLAGFGTELIDRIEGGGLYATLAAKTISRKVMLWGRNAQGQCGNGALVDLSVPYTPTGGWQGSVDDVRIGGADGYASAYVRCGSVIRAAGYNGACNLINGANGTDAATFAVVAGVPTGGAIVDWTVAGASDQYGVLVALADGRLLSGGAGAVGELGWQVVAGAHPVLEEVRIPGQRGAKGDAGDEAAAAAAAVAAAASQTAAATQAALATTKASLTSADRAQTGADAAATAADRSATHVDRLAADADAAATAADRVQTGSDRTSATSSAATASIQATNAAASAASAAATLASGLHLYDRENGGLIVRPLTPTGVGGTVTKNSDRSITLAAGTGNTAYFDIALTAAQIAAASVTVECKVVSALTGSTFTTATYEQRSAGASIVAAVALDRESARLIKRAVSLNAATTIIRVYLQNNASTATTVYAPSVGIKEPATPATDGSLVALDALLLDAVNAQTNLWPVPTAQLVSGSAFMRTGSSWAIPAASFSILNAAMPGFASTDTCTVLFQLSSPVASVGVQPGVSGVSSGTITPAMDLGNGWYGATVTMISGGAAANQISLRIDNTTQLGYTSAASVLSMPWAGKNAPAFPGILTIPAPVAKALADAKVATAYVDPVNGSDTNNDGTRTTPYATLTKALLAGATNIGVRCNGVLREQTITITGKDKVRLFSYQETGDSYARARLWFSTNYPAASWTNDATYTNLWYITGITSTPGGAFEVLTSTGVWTRYTHTAKSTSSPSMFAPSLTAANGVIGSLFWDSGTNRLYIYPFGGTLTGKSVEVPSALGMSVIGCGDFSMVNFENAGAKDGPLVLTRTTARVERCLIGRNGVSASNGNGLYVDTGSSLTDIDNIIDDCANDGSGSATGAGIIVRIGSTYSNNRGDGVSHDGAGVQETIIGCRHVNNGKNGFVSINSGAVVIEGCTFTGNLGQDCIYAFGNATSTTTATVDISNSYADWWSFQGHPSASSDTNLTVNMRNITGPVTTSKATVDISGMTARNDGTGKTSHGMQMYLSGTLSVRNFKVSGFNYGAMIVTGGTLNLKQGHLLRNTTAAIYQDAGTLNLSSADPVNQFGNAAVSSGSPGVSAPNLALLQNFNAV